MPELKLSVKCTILAELEVEPQYLSLQPDKKGLIQHVLKLSTQKKDLEVQDMTFTENNKSTDNKNNWQTNLPLRFSYKLTKSPEQQANGYFNYQLDISLAKQDSTIMYGQFTIKTNHPKKPVLTFSGTILEPAK